MVNKSAVPLTSDEILDLLEEDLGDLVVVVYGLPYCDEDLHGCRLCELRTVDRLDLDKDCLCETCAAEVLTEAEHLRQLRSDYHRSVI